MMMMIVVAVVDPPMFSQFNLRKAPIVAPCKTPEHRTAVSQNGKLWSYVMPSNEIHGTTF